MVEALPQTALRNQAILDRLNIALRTSPVCLVLTRQFRSLCAIDLSRAPSAVEEVIALALALPL